MGIAAQLDTRTVMLSTRAQVLSLLNVIVKLAISKNYELMWILRRNRAVRNTKPDHGENKPYLLLVECQPPLMRYFLIPP